MRYSFISEGENHYVCLHAETAMRLRMMGDAYAAKCLQNHVLFWDTTEEIIQEEFSGGNLFLDFAKLEEAENGVAKLLVDAMLHWFSCGCDVYFLRIEPSFYQHMKRELERLRKYGCLIIMPDADEKIAIRFAKTPPEERCDIWIRNTLRRIDQENIMILREETPAGKKIPVVRLLAQEEHCLIYFFYRMAMRMIESQMCHCGYEENKGIYLMPVNEDAIPIAMELAAFLNMEIVEPQEESVKPGGRYIIVRDVIRLTCQQNSLNAMIRSAGGEPAGAVCLLDIYTGMGAKEKRVSFYTINTDRGSEFKVFWLKR